MKSSPTSLSPSKLMEGRIVEWNTDQGYGFLFCGAERWFLHMRSFAARNVIPAKGDRVRFVSGVDPRGRPCAAESVLIPRKMRRVAEHLLTLPLLLVVPVLAITQLPQYFWSVVLILCSLSLLTFSLHWRDKKAALAGNRTRVPEIGLQFLELAGGWPGGLLAQRLLRHKTSKTAYQRSFWLVVLGHQTLAFESVLISSGVWQAVLWEAGNLGFW